MEGRQMGMLLGLKRKSKHPPGIKKPGHAGLFLCPNLQEMITLADFSFLP